MKRLSVLLLLCSWGVFCDVISWSTTVTVSDSCSVSGAEVFTVQYFFNQGGSEGISVPANPVDPSSASVFTSSLSSTSVTNVMVSNPSNSYGSSIDWEFPTVSIGSVTYTWSVNYTASTKIQRNEPPAGSEDFHHYANGVEITASNNAYFGWDRSYRPLGSINHQRSITFIFPSALSPSAQIFPPPDSVSGNTLIYYNVTDQPHFPQIEFYFPGGSGISTCVNMNSSSSLGVSSLLTLAAMFVCLLHL
jgi:hypothetical protein